MNKWLVGNGRWCEACRERPGQGDVTDVYQTGHGFSYHFRERCKACNGEPRIPTACPPGDTPHE